MEYLERVVGTNRYFMALFDFIWNSIVQIGITLLLMSMLLFVWGIVNYSNICKKNGYDGFIMVNYQPACYYDNYPGDPLLTYVSDIKGQPIP